MNMKTLLTQFTFLLMMSFASVNAVLFTPALPEITQFFHLTNASAQLTITWYLIGYALGQLVYGPLANRFGRKNALVIGISLEMLSALCCIIAGNLSCYPLLIVGRFLMALGSGVGLKMTFTLVNETLSPAQASRTMSYLLAAFAITPGIAVMLGGIINTHFGWTSTFYASFFYGVILMLLIRHLPETKKEIDIHALRWSNLLHNYLIEFKNKKLIFAGLLMGTSGAFIYVFAALAPFIAINLLNMSSSDYGTANLIPSLGLVIGSILSAQLVKYCRPISLVFTGILIALVGSGMMLCAALLHLSALAILFLPMAFCYVGLAFIFSNASSIAMSYATDKANGSAVMNFTNLGLITAVVLSLGLVSVQVLLLPIVYLVISSMMLLIMLRWQLEA